MVGNYLKGETPPPFDLLYWNSDSTNLPGPFYAWYLRNTYLENRLVQPGKATVCGEKVDLRKLGSLPVYIYGSRDDHIVPIGNQKGGAYASTQVLPGKKRFVMGASGHIAGVINPPAANKRSHWTREDGKLPKTQAEWAAGAKEHPGSWWTDWSNWLKGHAGKQIPAPKTYGKGKYKGSKVPKQINRRARDAMMIATVHHVAAVPASKTYFDKKRAAGKTHQQAVRATARILAKVLFAMLKKGIDYKRPEDPAAQPANPIS